MLRKIARMAFAAALSLAAALGQSDATRARFEIADVQVSAPVNNQIGRFAGIHNGRYEIRSATMLDLIRTAYAFDADKVLGGPSWLELDRFDVTSKVADDTPPDTVREMLQALLAERFGVVLHRDTKPLTAWVLTAGKKPQLKAADGSGDSGCKAQSQTAAPGDGSITLHGSAVGPNTVFTIAGDLMIPFQCRNMTMSAFAAVLPRMMGVSLGANPVIDHTGLDGQWNFNVKWSYDGPLRAGPVEKVTVFDAIDKQLGLRLEQQPVPTLVIVVDRANRQPSANSAGVAEAFPAAPAPNAFEVADVKSTDPAFRGGRYQVQPGGRFVAEGVTMQTLLIRAFNSNRDEIFGAPKWAETERFDITARVASGGPALDQSSLPPVLLALLQDRFAMKFHREERSVAAYTLLADKPKLIKADPSARTSCRFVSPLPPGTPLGSMVLNCRNAPLSLLARYLINTSPGLNWPILDATGIEGGWDMTLTFNPSGVPTGSASQQADGTAAASDPGGGRTLFEALEKQLGLKLELQKRPMPVIVIDSLEQKPTDN